MINHLWQSTVFAVLTAILTLAFRENRAQVRYWLWFGASLKFLIPFSLLMSLGSYLQWTPVETIASPAVSSTVAQFTQPFPETAAIMPSTAGTVDWIPLVVLGAWVWGFAAIGLLRLRGWLRIRAAVRSSSPLKISVPVEVRSSPGLLEPGVVGLLRPILLLPEGIAECLTPRQLEAVLAHELCHIRRRDNLTSAVHMIVEAAFWFHPLVWWIGARLVDERERACDEAVLSLGNEPTVYAEAIVSVHKSYLVSPLRCVAGVGGANLKKRIEEIMRNRIGQNVNFSRKMLLVAAGVSAVAGPVVIGIGTSQLRAQSPKLAFEVASVKPFKGDPRDMRGTEFLPGGKLVSRAPLLLVIATAYNTSFEGKVPRITGIPKWLNSPESFYEIEATAPSGAIPEGLSPRERTDKMRLMLQALLADRFKLTIRREAKEMPIYALVVGNGGPKLAKADVQEKDCPDTPLSEPAASAVCHRFTGGRGRGLHGRAVDMTDLVGFVHNWTDRPLFDKTGLKGLYKIDTEPFQPMELAASTPAPGTKQDGVDMRDLPTLFTVFDRLGLRMESQKGKVDTYVIEHIEKPAAN